MAKKGRVKKDEEKVPSEDVFVVLEIKDPKRRRRNRIVQLNLDDEDDWFEIATGTCPNGRGWAGVGNDEDDRWPVVRAFKLLPDAEMHNGNRATAEAITLRELHRLVMERIEKYSG